MSEQSKKSAGEQANAVYEALEKDWLLTMNTDYSDTERLFWFASKDQKNPKTLKFAACNGVTAWNKLAEHLENPGPAEPELNRAARLHQARIIDEQIKSLIQRQDALLDPLMADMDKKSIRELVELHAEMPSGFHRSELQNMINRKSGINPLAGLDISGIKR